MSELKPCQMAADEAISALEMCQVLMLFDPMTGETHELCEENKDNQDLYNACSLAIDALRRAQPANEPLTIDELREMDGEPVFVASPGVEEYGHWGIVCGVDDTAGRTLYLRGDYSCHDYGKTWLAYRRPPERSENDA